MHKGICILIAVILSGLNSNVFAASKINDIRILVDVSGSMKKTDPLNLRVSASKLLNGLIPDGSNAGVWTFGRYVDMTVKWGRVDNGWRKAADSGASKIHSNALFTNIERGIARATRGWEKPDLNTRRIVILLTDGQVDISKDAAKNDQSRQNVLTKSLQNLKKSGAEVHAIALSRFSDEALLKQLSLETGGSFEVAESAEDLQRIFFRTFERATKPDTVKLTGNQFSIDKSVKEMTLLIFRQKHSAPTVLYAPDGSTINLKKPGRSTWRSDSGYDLITIKKPKTGLWNIDADLDPDSRLMVITSLKLNIGGLRPYMMPGQPVNITAELHNKEVKIKKNSFLRFVDFSSSHTGTDENEKISELKHTSVRADKGRYLLNIENGLEEGTHSFVISADSRTFNRSKRFNIEVQWPVEVKIKSSKIPGKYKIRIKPREEYLMPSSLLPSVILQAPDDSQQDLKLVLIKDSWTGEITTSQEGVYQALVNIEARSVNDEAVSLDLSPFPVIGVLQPDLPAGPDAKSGKEDLGTSDAAVESVADSVAEAEQVTNAEKPENQNQPDWVRISIAIAVANLLMIILVAAVWFILRKRKADPDLMLDEAETDA